jgi:TniQ
MPDLPPLSRSLNPLPGESLRGFVLRLSYRLELAPARIAERTGLVIAGVSGARAPASLLTDIPEAAKPTFTHATRLSIEQVDQLVLASLRPRYPFPSSTTDNRGPDKRLITSRTILFPQTRFCPDCLAGDGTPIQDAFGGPWLKLWHLPVVFACPTHQRLLEHLCPDCEQPIHARRPGAANLLLPAMRARPLHPAQCRTPTDPALGLTFPTCCGARLDQHGPTSRAPDPELLTLQHKILELLSPNGTAATISTGQKVSPDQYFTDLQALTLLVCTTWPAARNLSPSSAATDAIDHHIASLWKQAADRETQHPASPARVTFDAPPPEAAASAGLSHIADRLLLSGGPDEVHDHLRPLLPNGTRKASRTTWGLRVLRTTTPCSDGLQAAYLPLLRTFTKTGGHPQARREATIQPQHWGPEHIPAFLPKDWYERHFTPITGINPMFTRRTAALRLIQMVAGGSLGEAAGYLGIATTHTTWQGRIYAGAGHVHSNAKRQPDPEGFETALKNLAAELDDPATPLINYQQRRKALQTWAITPATWQDLTSRLPPVPGPQRPELGDRKRQIASIYVWVQVTSGEHYFAPRPIADAQTPEIQQAWQERQGTIWHLLLKQNQRRRPHYTGLRAALNTLAATLATVIDTQRPEPQPPTKPGNRHL